MGGKLSGRVTRQYTVGLGFHAPFTARTSRATAPAFADGFQPLTIAGMENVTLTVATPSLASGASATVTGTQGFKTLNGLTVTSSDLGQFHIGNVSVVGPGNVIVGHPTLTVTTAQGTPVGGALATGQTYSGAALSLSVPIYATGAASAGTLQVTATILLLGTALGN